MTDSELAEEQTFDDFKKMMESSYPTSTSDIIADKYDGIVPKSVQLLSNLDPTGIASTINQYITENKAKREHENILYAIYLCRKLILKHQNTLCNLKKEYLEQQGPELMNLYFEHCKNTYNRKKIEFFRNVWINGMIKDDRDLDEKAYIFDLAASLTLDQIIVLRYIYKNTTNETDKLNLEYIANELKIKNARVQHICTNLQSRGLLQIIYQTGGGWGGGALVTGGDVFRMTEYVRDFVAYLMEPDFASGPEEDHHETKSPESDHS